MLQAAQPPHAPRVVVFSDLHQRAAKPGPQDIEYHNHIINVVKAKGGKQRRVPPNIITLAGYTGSRSKMFSLSLVCVEQQRPRFHSAIITKLFFNQTTRVDGDLLKIGLAQRAYDLLSDIRG